MVNLMKLDSTPTRLLVLLSVAACSSDPEPPGNRDAGFIVQNRDAGFDVVGDPVDGVLEPLDDGEVSFAATLTDGTVVADGPDGLRRVASSTVVDIGDEAGDVVAVVDLGGGALVGGSLGLFALVDDQLERSPINDVIGTVVPSDLVVAPDGRVWIASNRGIHVWRGGSSFQISPAGLPDQNAKLSFGAPIGGSRAMWVAAGERLYGVVLDGNTPQAYPQALEADIRSLATSSDQTLWIIERGGILRSRRVDGTWREHDTVSDGVRVVAASDGAVWIQTMTGVYRHHDGVFSEVRGIPLPIHHASIEGSVLAGGDRLVRAFAELRVAFDGIDEGALLVAATEIEIRPLLPDRVTSVSVTLDGMALDAGTRPWRITIDPSTLADGTHVLAATATYDDGGEATAERRFSYFMGPVPNWTDDVAPLREKSCDLCHGQRGSARVLDTAALWQDEIDLILFNVREGRMPLMPEPPLTTAEIGVIEGWAAAGFPINGE